MKRVIFTALFLIVFVTDANAMRCSRKLVRVGDYVSKMFNYCGNPVFTMKDTSIRGDRVVYMYKMNGRNQIITAVDNVIRDMRSE